MKFFTADLSEILLAERRDEGEIDYLTGELSQIVKVSFRLLRLRDKVIWSKEKHTEISEILGCRKSFLRRKYSVFFIVSLIGQFFQVFF